MCKRGVSCIIALILLMYSLSIKAQESYEIYGNDSSSVARTKIYYPVNRVDILENYMGNSEELAKIKRLLLEFPRIDSVIIYSYASPEGRYEFNRWLATERGKAAKRYILANLPKDRTLSDSLIHLRFVPENWEGMRSEIVSKYPLSDKAKVLEIIDRKDISDAQREQLLRTLNGGQPWQFIIKNIMPQLRYAAGISVWYPAHTAVVVSEACRLPFIPLTVKSTLAKTAQLGEEKKSRTILALKTNMLYDAVSWLNYSIEVPLGGNRFSVLFYHQFPWWTWGKNNNEYCMRFLGLGGEGRWWFKPEPRLGSANLKKRDCLVGHFVGVYGESGKYDFERKKDICYQGEYWSVGLSYGYSMPISRGLNLELSLSGGYASIAYRGYTPSPDYSVLLRDLENTGRWNYWGITKAQVSLVVPIVVNVKKGGRK